MSEGAACWLELSNIPGCYVFQGSLNPSETVTWSGACEDGIADGQGTYAWDTADSFGEATGTLVRGKLHGLWIAYINDDFCWASEWNHGEFLETKSDC